MLASMVTEKEKEGGTPDQIVRRQRRTKYASADVLVLAGIVETILPELVALMAKADGEDVQAVRLYNEVRSSLEQLWRKTNGAKKDS